MTKKGTKKIVKSLNPDGLKRIDLSDNRVGEEAMAALIKGILHRNSTI
jgi:Ran GTPase-activating protein (RanGAP) involved in mRNA processing and transport